MKFLPVLLLTGILLPGLPVFAQTITANEVVKKYLVAIGGEEAWKTVQTMRSTGTMKLGGRDLNLVLTAVHGKGYRSDYTVAGRTGFTIITPTAGWYYNPGDPGAKAEAMTAEQVAKSQDQLDIQGELVDYKARGHTVAYIGKEAWENVPCYRLKLTLKSGTVSTWYIDVTTNYLLRTVSKSTEAGGEDDITRFSNYKKLPEGIVMPMTWGTSNGEIRLTEVEINKPVDEKVFTPGG